MNPRLTSLQACLIILSGLAIMLAALVAGVIVLHRHNVGEAQHYDAAQKDICTRMLRVARTSSDTVQALSVRPADAINGPMCVEYLP